MFNEYGYEVGSMEFYTDTSFGSNISVPRVFLKRTDVLGQSDEELTLTSQNIQIEQIFRDGTYGVSLDVSGLTFTKDGVQTKRYGST